ncbi:hypothetical protein Tco_1491198 [Tanacetum coccineum]
MPTKTEITVREADAMNGAENKAENKSIKTHENDEAVEAPGSQPVAYYLKHKINKKLIKGLVKNNRFNNSLSGTRVGKKKGKAYKVLFGGPIYDAILKKNITKKEDVRGNFEMPYIIGDLKHVNALVDQGFDVNVMPYSTYMRLTDERPAETDIRLSLASHSSGKNKVSFHRIFDSSCITDKGVKNDIEPITPIMTVNRLVIEWEERIKLHLEKEMKFNPWRSNNFKNKQPAPVKVERGMDDEEVM